jgi:hypothetical protein
MPGQHLLEQWPLDGDVAAEIERGVSQHLIDGVALLLAHGALLSVGFHDPVID